LITDPAVATKTALRRIARRCQALHAEILDANKELNLLLAAVAIVDLPSGRQSGRERRSACLRWN